MRKAFNFYKSYFDVYLELPDKEKIKFIDALLKKEFWGIEPDLKGLSRFAYLSQKHSINAQVKGFEDKTKTTLQPPTQPPTQPPLIQEKEKEKEKEKEQYIYLFSDFWDKYHLITKKPKTDREVALKYWKKLSDIEKEKAIKNIQDYYNSINDKKYVKKARTYLSDKNFNDEFKKSLIKDYNRNAFI